MTGFYPFNYSSSMNSKVNESRPIDKDQPVDSISAILWNVYYHEPAFFTASWDGYVRYYTISTNNSSTFEVKLAWCYFFHHPVLTIDVTPDNVLFAGLATGDIAAIQMVNNEITKLGQHEAPICGLYYLRDKECLMSLGFDNSVCFWNLKSNSGRPEADIKLPLKTHTCSFDWPFLLIGSCESTISIVNLKNLPNCNFPQ